MAHIKHALIRYRLIDKCLRNKYDPFPSKLKLRQICEEHLYGSQDGENICDSTIEKDLFSMKMEHDAPIKYNKKENGYFYTDENFSIDNIPLTEDDIQSIQFAASTLYQFRDNAFVKQFGNAIDKIFERVTISQNPQAQEVENYVDFEKSNSTIGGEYLSMLLEAIRLKKQVEFDYESYVSAKRKKRIVSPYLLKEFTNRWYLVCLDSEKNSIVTYALERMFEPIILESKITEDANFNAKEYFKNSIGITGNQEPHEIVVKVDNISAKYMLSLPLHKSQELLKQGKNRVTFKLTVGKSEELFRTLLSFAGDLEVVSPPIIRNELKARVEKMRLNYLD